ncbi:MAG: Pycsar system effector family protein [Cyclobacteriaceae bacterium]
MKQLEKKVEAFVRDYFTKEGSKKRHYHNLEHTIGVVNNTVMIAKNSGCSKADTYLLTIAAWFHDLGYLAGGCKGHEVRGCELISSFMDKQDVDESTVTKIKSLIMATNLELEPTTLLEQIMKDADTLHLGDVKAFLKSSNKLRKEIKEEGKALSKLEWYEMTLSFMKKHSFYSPFVKENYDAGKKLNISVVEKEIEMAKEKKKKSEAEELPAKGIETMFRISLRNHVNLSRIADNKANTLLSVNAIIVSIVLSTLYPKLDNNAFLFYPSSILLITSMLTIFVSILSTVPKNTHGKISRDEVSAKKGNLLFFGNFHNMDIKDYEWSVNELMKDKTYLYNTLIRDLYYLGKVLEKKYSLLKIAYYIFVVGIFISISLFVLSINNVIGTGVIE